jgi:suppressor of tumorigenicity protein 14
VALYCHLDGAGFGSCITKCEPAPFTCGSGEQVKASDKCDGYEDCSDASDEAGCATFACADGSSTIPVKDKCDAFEDCSDGSDEVGCTNLFECGDGEKVLVTDKCDGHEHCSNGADEAGCPPQGPDLDSAIEQDCQGR